MKLQTKISRLAKLHKQLRWLNWQDVPSLWKMNISREELDAYYLRGLLSENEYEQELDNLEIKGQI